MVNISVILKEKVYLDLDDVNWAREEDITSSKEPEFSNLPRTWKEFCDKYPVQANEHYIDKGQAVDYNAARYRVQCICHILNIHQKKRLTDDLRRLNYNKNCRL